MKIVTFVMSVFLFATSIAVYADPTSGIPNLTGIAMDSSGNPLNFDQAGAVQYCRSLGDRLPTNRELALWATQFGAKISNNPQRGFDEIQGTDSAGNPDTFYYQYSGYKAPAGEMSQYGYWSSSVVPADSNYAFFLDVDAGYFVHNNSFYDGTALVRCVQQPQG